jgi:hypothetical protein
VKLVPLAHTFSSANIIISYYIHVTWVYKPTIKENTIRELTYMAIYILIIPYIFLPLVHQPTKVLNKIQFVTRTKLLHVSAQR